MGAPKFPEFRKLGISDKEWLEEFTARLHYHHSDFNFAGMWTWNLKETLAISQHYGNLIFMFVDYMAEPPFYSFLGNHEPVRTIANLLSLKKYRDFDPKLKLVPESNIAGHEQEISKVCKLIPDRDSFDYVYSLKEMAELKGKSYHHHRVLIRRFLEYYPDHKVVVLSLSKTRVQEDIVSLFKRWVSTKLQFDREELELDLQVLKRNLQLSSQLGVQGLGIYIKDILIAFNTFKPVHDHYAMAYFKKADIRYKGVYQYLDQKRAQFLASVGCEHINCEQDLGIPNLRRTKLSLNPVKLLKKYIIQPK